VRRAEDRRRALKDLMIAQLLDVGCFIVVLSWLFATLCWQAFSNSKKCGVVWCGVVVATCSFGAQDKLEGKLCWSKHKQ